MNNGNLELLSTEVGNCFSFCFSYKPTEVHIHNVPFVAQYCDCVDHLVLEEGGKRGECVEGMLCGSELCPCSLQLFLPL